MKTGKAYVSCYHSSDYYARLNSIQDVECNRYNGKKGQGMFVKKSSKKKAGVRSITCHMQ